MGGRPASAARRGSRRRRRRRRTRPGRQPRGSTITPMEDPDLRRTAAGRLVVDLVGDPGHPLASELLRWASASARDRTWLEANSAKIRKKLRAASDADALADVAVELRAAAALLGDRRFEVAFEAYGSGNAGPDFSATFRGGARFNLEVTRP